LAEGFAEIFGAETFGAALATGLEAVFATGLTTGFAAGLETALETGLTTDLATDLVTGLTTDLADTAVLPFDGAALLDAGFAWTLPLGVAADLAFFCLDAGTDFFDDAMTGHSYIVPGWSRNEGGSDTQLPFGAERNKPPTLRP
jgi:hypothetical protein